jgi:hypothetical protein
VNLLNKILPGLFLLLLYGCAALSSYGAQASIDGYWEGTGGEPGDELKFMLTFKTEADGIQGAIDIPDTAPSKSFPKPITDCWSSPHMAARNWPLAF